MKMGKITGKFQFIKDYDRKLDERYGIGSIKPLDTIKIAVIMLVVCAISFIQIIKEPNSSIMAFIYFIYLFIISLLTLLMIFLLERYDKPSHKIRNHQKNKNVLKKIIIFLYFIFILAASPVLLLLSGLNIIASLFNIEIFARNMNVIIINSLVYSVAYYFCLVFNQSHITTLGYILINFIIGILTNRFLYFINRIYKFTSYLEKYDYSRYSKNALTYIVNAITISSGIACLYFSETIISLILPIIIFNGFEQLSMLSIQRPNEKRSFVNALYNELINLQDIAYSQITDFSCMKIRIKLHIAPYIIENYINYFQTELSKDNFIKFKKRKRKLNQKLIETLNDCKSLLSKEYDVYQEKEKSAFEKDLANAIENLAQYLTHNI